LNIFKLNCSDIIDPLQVKIQQLLRAGRGHRLSAAGDSVAGMNSISDPCSRGWHNFWVARPVRRNILRQLE